MTAVNINKLEIRNYQKGDFAEIIAIWESLGLGNKIRGDNEEVILNTLKIGGVFFVLYLKQTNQIIGTSWITTDARRLFLHHFGIIKQYQGQGLSHLLLKKSLEFAKQSKMQIKLEVHQSNVKAQNLYKKSGFKYLGDYLVYIIREY